MIDSTLTIDGIEVPRFLYGTAWKEERTERLVELALRQGFRGIDTANQRRHYHEAAVGQAILGALADGFEVPSYADGFEVPSYADGRLVRDELFVQTKFTFRRGQDHRLPYDPDAPVDRQVEQSFARSLAHLGVEHIDSYLLHGPSSSVGLTGDDWAAWRSMEAICGSGRARLLGVSNFRIDQLRLLCEQASVLPRFVQNRCYAASRWDLEVREFCAENGIVYQGFSLLTANPQVLASPVTARIAARRGRTVAQIIFRFALDVGMIPLTGTADAEHMRQDLDVFTFRLDPDEIARIERIG